MNDNNDFFLKQMKGVSPIKKNNRIEKQKSVIKKQVIKKPLKKLNVSTTSINNKIFDKQPKFDLESINIRKNLKKKLFRIDKKIDFHGANLLESENLFINTITDCYDLGLRCLLFVTGKGLFKAKKNNENEPPKLYHGVIRSSFISWVTSSKFSRKILSYEKASNEHGGDGAFYVYLRRKKN